MAGTRIITGAFFSLGSHTEIKEALAKSHVQEEEAENLGCDP